MPLFHYKGKDVTGKIITGSIEAEDKDLAVGLLRNRKINITEVKKDWKSISLKLPEKIVDEDIVISTRQMGVMINSGLPIVRSLEILSTQSPKQRMRKIFMDVKNSIETGQEFNKALGKFRNEFGDLYINMIAAGEAGGLLDIILDRLGTYLEKSITLKRKVKSAMTYPIIVLVVAIVVIYGLMVFIIPKFADMYSSFGGELPALTQFALAMSKFMSSWYGGGAIAVGIIGTVVALRLTYKKSPAGRYKLDQILLKLPKFGDLIRKMSVAKFTRTFGTLIASGVPILDAIDIVAKTSGNKVIEKVLMDSKREIEGGKTIVEPLEKSGVFPPMVTQMISVGEETGNLDQMLTKIADFYDEEVDRAVESLTKMIEPFLMLFVGGAVGFVIIAMYLPIFNLGAII